MRRQINRGGKRPSSPTANGGSRAPQHGPLLRRSGFANRGFEPTRFYVRTPPFPVPLSPQAGGSVPERGERSGVVAAPFQRREGPAFGVTCLDLAVAQENGLHAQ